MVYIIQTENMCYKEVWKNIKRNWKKAIQKNRINDIIYNENRRMKKSYKITKIITIKLYFEEGVYKEKNSFIRWLNNK